ncbi:hypothetical protein WJX73_009584, partial [Symbiochloris irregularis]
MALRAAQALALLLCFTLLINGMADTTAVDQAGTSLDFAGRKLLAGSK